MSGKGASPGTLAALQNPSVESIGRSVVILSNIDPALEEEAREFQEAAAALVINDLAPRARALRESIETRIALAKNAADTLERQIKDDADEIERISVLTDNLRSELEKQRASLATLYQRTGAEQQPGGSSTIEAHIREMHEQISSQTNSIANLFLERSNVTRDLATTRRLLDTQGKVVADAQFEKNSFNETHISLRPTLMPTTGPAKRTLSLLLIALTISLLAGFGTAVMSHNLSTRKI